PRRRATTRSPGFPRPSARRCSTRCASCAAISRSAAPRRALRTRRGAMPRDNGAQLAQHGRRGIARRLRMPLLLLGPLLVIVVAAYFYVTGGRYVSTDDAYIRYNKVLISSDVAGRIVKQAVDENDVVKQGQ